MRWLILNNFHDSTLNVSSYFDWLKKIKRQQSMLLLNRRLFLYACLMEISWTSICFQISSSGLTDSYNCSCLFILQLQTDGKIKNKNTLCSAIKPLVVLKRCLMLKHPNKLVGLWPGWELSKDAVWIGNFPIFNLKQKHL